jgi:hypothetical protein
MMYHVQIPGLVGVIDVGSPGAVLKKQLQRRSLHQLHQLLLQQ